MDPGSKSVRSIHDVDDHPEDVCAALNRDTTARTATKSSKAIPDDSAFADLGDKSSTRNRTVARAQLADNDCLEVPNVAAPLPRTTQRSMYSVAPLLSRPHRDNDTIRASISPRTPYQPPPSDIVNTTQDGDCLLVVDGERHGFEDLFARAKVFSVSTAAIARASPTMMEQLSIGHAPDGHLSIEPGATYATMTPAGRPILHLHGEDPRDMRVILDAIHDNIEAISSCLGRGRDVHEGVAKARRIALLAKKYKVAHKLESFVQPWFNSLKKSLSKEDQMELLNVHRILNRASMKEAKVTANRWGIAAPESTNHRQKLLERLSEPEGEPRDLADIHAENVRKAAANASQNDTHSVNPLPRQRPTASRPPVPLYPWDGSAPTSQPVVQNNLPPSEHLDPTITRNTAEGSETRPS